MTTTIVLSAAAMLAAYLIGSIPFGYLLTYWVKGIDIRTVGSGNLGATNVGRTLGFRYFVLVLLLDMLKGFLPTLGFPAMAGRMSGLAPPALPVLVAMSAILGHTFPVYLKFRGGKGVATSIGTVLALDPISSGYAVATFGVFFFLTRFVSLASLGGGAGFVAAHFARTVSPFSREHISMSLFSISVLVLLLARHRGNLARIWAGTERRVGSGTKKNDGAAPPAAAGGSSGKVLWMVLFGLVVLSASLIGGYEIYRITNEPIVVNAGPWTLRETERATTGQQRVDSVAFSADGTRLAATCPRYDRILIYHVEPGGKLTNGREIQLEGRPVALAALGDRFLVLETPTGDQRHVEPGWWERFDRDGNRVGGRNLAGYYPDDLAVSPDGKYLFVLSSGQAEGDAKKPMPGLEIVAIDSQLENSRVVGKVNFDATDDPCRLALSAGSSCAAVLLTRTNQTLAIDLADRAHPRVIGRIKASGSDAPYVSYSEDSDWIMMPVASQSEGIAIRLPQVGENPAAEDSEEARVRHVDFLICTRHHDSVLELFQTEPRQSLGRLPLKGPLNIGRTRPTGLAYSRDRGLLAVATRSGTIHMVEMVPRSGPQRQAAGAVAAAAHDSERKVR